jgi:hypothetical protein
MAALPVFLQRWNFIERARLERQLWDAFERGDDLDALLASEAPGFRQEVWTTTLVRIRRIELLMRDQQRPKG